MGEASPVLLYKRQGEQPESCSTGLATDDFVLGLQTTTQRQFMLEFGADSVVCLDNTHGTNQYGFNLITLLVVDDFGESNPVAFMISAKEDESVLVAFFGSIKARLPAASTFRASHVMTDDASQYHSAWVSVFGNAEKRLCVWHVDRAWRRAIMENIPNRETQVETYHMVCSVMQELDTDVFRQCSSSLLSQLQQTAPKFASCFSSYCVRAPEWAYCYRKGTRANTSTYIESFHNVLLSAYMERKTNGRVDTLLDILLKIASDKASERQVKLEKQSESKKLYEVNKRHAVLVRQLPPQTNGGWLIASESVPGQQYFVVTASDTCGCSLLCSSCNCCPHLYKCSCTDFALHATVCKHVHTVHALLHTSNNIQPPTADVESGEANLDLTENQQQPEEGSTIPIVVEDFLSDCRQLMAMVTSGRYGRNVLSAAKKHLSAAKSVFELGRPSRLDVITRWSSNQSFV